MKKRWTAALLALLLTTALLPSTAHAAPADHAAGSSLTGVNRAVYEALEEAAILISSGRRTSTAIQIPNQPALCWTLDELGLSGARNEDVLKTLDQKLSDALNFELVYVCLSLDHPLEMFWKSNQFTLGYSFLRSGNQVSVADLTAQLQVAQDCRGGSDMNVDPKSIEAAAQAADSAKAIVEKYRDRSDYEKLAGYCQEICQLVSYDLEALTAGTPYGAPWQLVSVFDGDPDTNVVCEGYSKAFQYLCDLTDFDGDIVCRTISGNMNGNHMWNVVQMEDGRNYLVDVTNCDDKMVGEDGELFLSGASSTDGGRTYTVSKGSCRAVYTYSDLMEGLYGDGWLQISPDDYEPGAAQPSPAPSDSPAPAAFTDVAPDAYYAQAVAWAVEQGITNGTSSTTFSPGKECSEAEVLTFLWRAAGKPDIGYGPQDSANFWDSAVGWFYDIGMIPQGAPFDPSRPCTRATAVNSIWWAFRLPEPAGAAGFGDVPRDYAKPVAWAVEQGVTNGTSDTAFSPDKVCTRGEIVTFLYRAYHGRS